jgi:hypothetical protein
MSPVDFTFTRFKKLSHFQNLHEKNEQIRLFSGVKDQQLNCEQEFDS